MKRLLASLLCLCLLPCAYTAAENETPAPVIETVTLAPEEPDPSPVPIPPDPNWILAADEPETVEAFAQTAAEERHRGMRPLSRYARAFTVTEADLKLAARVAYLEAGSRDERAYRAVLCVLYNRCAAKRFGGKITDIETEAYRKGQFSVIHRKGFRSLEPPEAIVEAARDIFVYGNLDLPESVLFFCAARLGKHWGGRTFYKDIGGNLFFYGSVD
jgi:hypothetical protein